MSNTGLSSFAQSSFMVPDWNSSYTGIDTNYNLADRIYQATTKKRTPTSSNFYANLVYIVDQSANTFNDHSNIVQFVSDSVTPFLVGSTKTQISIVPFADDVISPLQLTSSQTVSFRIYRTKNCNHLQTVDQYLTSWKSSLSSSSYSANVGNAITYVSNMIGNTPDRPTHIIYVVGATKRQYLVCDQLQCASNFNFMTCVLSNSSSLFSAVIVDLGNFSTSGNDTKMAVVSYGKSVNNVWTLGDLQDVVSLKNQISNFQIQTSTGPSNLRSQLWSGHQSTKLHYCYHWITNVYILLTTLMTSFFLFSITPNIDGPTSRHLNTRYSTYVIQTNFDNSTYPWTPQFLGTQLVSDRVAHSLDIKWFVLLVVYTERVLFSEYSAWTLTFPDKS
ncbi:hypothetical protein CAEBREN_28285 [Caenorhabditis brenneri]|uniref:VWFA domain-containing protein n=1 Tax=Caenorhabditis brenneri TaxID=135651 RepID=G0N7R4_CAEBE|nr:hypothetical protein CAEBREN_28285 [Caenorhabditis brenneri]